MSHKSLLCLIENSVRAIHDDIQFSYGLESAFAHEKKYAFTFVNVSPLNAVASFAVDGVFNYSKTWNVEMGFYKYDKKDNYDKAKILNDTDLLVDKFINKMNQADNITMASIVQTSFIEAVDIMTGHLLTFSITLNDSFDYCEICP